MNRNVLQILMVSMAVLAAHVLVCELDLAGDHRASAQDDAFPVENGSAAKNGSTTENGSGMAYTGRGMMRGRTADQMFYNYYVPPCGYPTTGAQLYLAPQATPPLVGHTWITNAAFMPHELLWKHGRTYRRHHPDGKTTTTHVRWR